MKLLTVAIPCYNSQDYMEKCIDSLLIGGEDVEIIIVDDGSKDMTPEIADSYAKKHPEIVRAIHQENGGHGRPSIHEYETAREFSLKLYQVLPGYKPRDKRRFWQPCVN